MIAELFGTDTRPWMRQPKPCDVEPERWFPTSEDLADRTAQQLCNGCPVVAPCFAYALEIDDAWAILGGTSPKQRRSLKPQTHHMGECMVCDAPMFGKPGQGGKRLYCSQTCKLQARRGKEAVA